MAKNIIELKLNELSLVDRPANPEAFAPIFKADSQKGDSKMSEETKILEAEKAELEKSLEDLKLENERLRKGLIDNGYTIKADTIEKKQEVEYIEVEGQKLVKSDIPAVILETLEKAEAEKVEAEITKNASEKLPNWDIEVAKSLFKFDLSEEVLEALVAADKLFEAAFQEAGQTTKNLDMGEPKTALEKALEDTRKEHKVSKAEAFAILSKTPDGADLINKAYYEKEA